MPTSPNLQTYSMFTDTSLTTLIMVPSTVVVASLSVSLTILVSAFLWSFVQAIVSPADAGEPWRTPANSGDLAKPGELWRTPANSGEPRRQTPAAISGDLWRILAPEIHKLSKPKGANARIRQGSSGFVGVRQGSPEFARVRQDSPSHKAVAMQTTLKTELREHCKIPKKQTLQTLSAMDRQKWSWTGKTGKRLWKR